MNNSPDNWISIASTIHTPQAVSWRDILTDAGIVCIVDPPTNHIEPYPTMAIAVSYELFVKPEDENQAREILEEMATPFEEE